MSRAMSLAVIIAAIGCYSVEVIIIMFRCGGGHVKVVVVAFEHVKMMLEVVLVVLLAVWCEVMVVICE